MLNSIPILPPNLGKIVTITPPAPAAGADFVFAVPIGTLILPISFSCQFVTDATAVTRTMILETFDGTDYTFLTPAQFLHVAGTTKQYNFQAGNNVLVTIGAFGQQMVNMSSLNYLRFGDILRTNIDNIQAGDAITAPVLKYMQWIQAT